MNIKEEILDYAPTKKTRIALLLLLLLEGVIFSIVPFLNPITFELNSKNLTWLSVCLALSLALIFSIFINFHLTNRLKKVSDWVNRHEWVKPDDDQKTT